MIEPFYDEYDTAPVYVLEVREPVQWRVLKIAVLVLIWLVVG